MLYSFFLWDAAHRKMITPVLIFEWIGEVFKQNIILFDILTCNLF